MHHDFFACVRLLLLIIMLLAFALLCRTYEKDILLEQQEQKESIYFAQATPRTIISPKR